MIYIYNLWISYWRSDSHSASSHSSCPANPADGISDGAIASYATQKVCRSNEKEMT